MKNFEYVTNPKTIGNIKVVNDENEALNALQNGETVMRFEWGDSMEPLLKNGEYAKLVPVQSLDEIQIGDAVFCGIKDVIGHEYLMTHMVRCISHTAKDGVMFQITDSWGRANYGWTNKVYAKAYGTNVCEKEMPKKSLFSKIYGAF